RRAGGAPRKGGTGGPSRSTRTSSRSSERGGGRPQVAVSRGQGRGRASQRQSAQGRGTGVDGHRERAGPADALPTSLHRPSPPVRDRGARRGRGGDGDRDGATCLHSPHEGREDDGADRRRGRDGAPQSRVLQPTVASPPA